MHILMMAAKSVQISLDEKLLKEIDRQKETREHGRSAFIRHALRLFLELQRRHEIDKGYQRAYGGKADQLWEEFAPLMESQRWPEE